MTRRNFIGQAAAAAVLAYRFIPLVQTRVALWQNPWSDPTNKGLQLVQGLKDGAVAGGHIRWEDRVIHGQMIGVLIDHQGYAVAVVDLPADSPYHNGTLGGAVLSVSANVLGAQLQGGQSDDINQANQQKDRPQAPQTGYALITDGCGHDGLLSGTNGLILE